MNFKIFDLIGNKVILIAMLMFQIFYSVAWAQSSLVQIIADKHNFIDLIDTKVKSELISDSSQWSEGPLCLRDGRFIWSDVKGNRVLTWKAGEAVKDFLNKSGFQNGHALDADGRILAASHGQRGIVRQEPSGRWHVLVDRYQGKRLNSPNDIIAASDGSIWFTDPTFGLKNKAEGYGGIQEQDGEYVYRFDPSSKSLIRLSTPGVRSPNGLAFSPDGKILYIADTELAHDFKNKALNHRIFAYEVRGSSLHNGRKFADISPGIPDGIKVDEKGNVWTSSQSGIQVYSQGGMRIGQLIVPAKDTSNLVFCKHNGKNWLYITAGSKVFRVQTIVPGAVKP